MRSPAVGLFLILLRCCHVNSFVHRQGFVGATRSSDTRRSMVGNAALRRRNIEIPLLDLSDSELAGEIVVPLPSSHLPHEISTLNVYGMVLRRPTHKMMIEQAIEQGEAFELGETGSRDRAYGCIVSKNGDSLLGAVGCSANIVLRASIPDENDNSDIGEDSSMTVLCKGAYRFVVKQVLKTFPYPVAIVDELMDETPENPEQASDLVRRTMVGLKTMIDHKLTEREILLTPLEQSILEENGVPVVDPATKQSQAEEMAAVFDVFQASLMDICPLPVDRYFSIGMMAAELANVDNDLRTKIIAMTDGVARLRLVCEHIELGLGMVRAREAATPSTNQLDEDVKVLKVGQPQLPPWAGQITKGCRLEYFWNEEWGWCPGIVSEEPIRVVDEILLMVTFDSDGQTHRLPLTAEDKVRWRPELKGSFD
jgi:hypothetical protein